MLNKIVEAGEVLARDGETAALRFLAKMPKALGQYRDRIEKAWAASRNPAFYAELGQDPAALLADGLRAVREITAVPETSAGRR